MAGDVLNSPGFFYLAAPTTRWVEPRPDQLILPPDDLPYAGYHTDEDRPERSDGWYRHFGASLGDPLVSIWLYVRAPAPVYTTSSCFPGLGQEEVTAPRVGQRTVACRWWIGPQERPVARVLWLRVYSRNVEMLVSLSANPRAVAEQRALDSAVEIARRQLERIDKIAPP